MDVQTLMEFYFWGKMFFMFGTIKFVVEALGAARGFEVKKKGESK